MYKGNTLDLKPFCHLKPKSHKLYPIMAANFVGHVADLLTLKANWFDTLTVKQWEVMINNDVLLFSATNEETPYEQLLYY